MQGRALLLPQIGASANYNYTNPITPAGQGGYDATTYGVNLQQPLFDVGKYTGYQKASWRRSRPRPASAPPSSN